MRQKLNGVTDKLFPSAEELWERGGAEMRPWNGTSVPFFDIEISDPEQIGDPEEILDNREGFRRRRFGREILYRVDVDGVDHLMRAFVPDDNFRTDDDFTITSGNAFTTTIDGYAHRRARRMFKQTQQPHVQVSSPHSDNERGWLEFTRVPETIQESLQGSLARRVQVEQAIMARVSHMHDFPMVQVAVGDSCDSITKPGQYPYAAEHGVHILDFDGRARCSLKRMHRAEHLPEVGLWTTRTILGGIGVGLCLAKKGELKSLRGTTSFNPNFVASSFTGTLQGLASDEPEIMMSWAPPEAHGIDVIYGRDTLVRLEDVYDGWRNNPNIYVKPVSNGNHASLLHPISGSEQEARMVRRTEQYLMAGGNDEKIDWSYVYGVHPDVWSPGLKAAA